MLFIVSPNKWIDNFKTVFHSICNRIPYLLFIANPIPPMFNGSSSTLRWQHFAIGLARSCHNGGKVVPSRWQSCAKPKKKFGTREVLLTGVNRRKSYIKQKPCNKCKASAEAGGFEPPVRLPVRQFSKLVVSATHPNFLNSINPAFPLKCGANVGQTFKLCKSFCDKLRKKP